MSICKKAVLLSLLVAMSFGCAKNGDSQRLRIRANPQMQEVLLSEAAEQLVTPNTFMLADKVADMALQKDPNDKKAQFYKLLVQPPMALKGIVTRLLPFVRQFGDLKQYQSWENQIPNSPARDFLYDGKEDIKTLTDVQNVVVQFRDRLNDFRAFLKQNPDLELTLYMNPWMFAKEIQEAMQDSCIVQQNDPTGVAVDCNYREVAQRKMNAADLVALTQVVTGQVLYLSLATNYSLEGLAELYQNDPMGQWTDQRRLIFLEGYADFGKLRTDHNLALLTSFGADASAAWKYVSQNQNTLCPATTYPWDKKRPHQLFQDGLCTSSVDSEAQRVLGLLDQALQGAIPVMLTTHQTGPRMFLIDAFKISKSPVADLKAIFPASYNQCGKATSLKDNTFGGVFPGRDGELLLNSQCDLPITHKFIFFLSQSNSFSNKD